MSAAALQACIERQHAQAALNLLLDEELGTQHGLAWADFLLLDLLDTADGALPAAQLAARLGVQRSRLVLQVLPLEKIGLVTRTAGAGARQVALRPPGRALLREARQTAAFVCERHAAGDR